MYCSKDEARFTLFVAFYVNVVNTAIDWKRKKTKKTALKITRSTAMSELQFQS